MCADLAARGAARGAGRRAPGRPGSGPSRWSNLAGPLGCATRWRSGRARARGSDRPASPGAAPRAAAPGVQQLRGRAACRCPARRRRPRLQRRSQGRVPRRRGPAVHPSRCPDLNGGEGPRAPPRSSACVRRVPRLHPPPPPSHRHRPHDSGPGRRRSAARPKKGARRATERWPSPRGAAVNGASPGVEVGVRVHAVERSGGRTRLGCAGVCLDGAAFGCSAAASGSVESRSVQTKVVVVVKLAGAV